MVGKMLKAAAISLEYSQLCNLKWLDVTNQCEKNLIDTVTIRIS